MKNTVQVINEFSHNLGMGRINLENQITSFEINGFGFLVLEFEANFILVSLQQNFPFISKQLCKRAFYECHYNEILPVVVNSGLKGNRTLVLFTRIPDEIFTLTHLEASIDILIFLQSKISGEPRE